MEKYYKIKKEHALRAGLNETLRTADGEDLLLSEKDIRMISLTIEERVIALEGVEYIEAAEPDVPDSDEEIHDPKEDPEIDEQGTDPELVTEDPEEVEPKIIEE